MKKIIYRENMECKCPDACQLNRCQIGRNGSNCVLEVKSDSPIIYNLSEHFPGSQGWAARDHGPGMASGMASGKLINS